MRAASVSRVQTLLARLLLGTDCQLLLRSNNRFSLRGVTAMIRKLASGKYRLYSRKANPKTGKRRNLGTFASRAAAQKHERAVQYFKRG
jgi:hypothetical protein